MTSPSKSSFDRFAMSDADIVAAVLAGDKDAYAEIIQRHQRRVFSILTRLVRSPSDAEELTQEVLCRTYFALPDFKPEYHFSSWISRIASNLGIDHIRRISRVTSLDDDAAGTALAEILRDSDRSNLPDRSYEEDETFRKLWRAVAALPPEFRDVVLMRHAEELSYLEIANATGLSMGTVKSRLARARQRLESALADTL